MRGSTQHVTCVTTFTPEKHNETKSSIVWCVLFSANNRIQQDNKW